MKYLRPSTSDPPNVLLSANKPHNLTLAVHDHPRHPTNSLLLSLAGTKFQGKTLILKWYKEEAPANVAVESAPVSKSATSAALPVIAATIAITTAPDGTSAPPEGIAASSAAEPVAITVKQEKEETNLLDEEDGLLADDDNAEEVR